MKKILTAIGNPMLNDRLKEERDWILLSDDITSDEELLDYLERGEEVDILFLCENIIQNYPVENFVDMIKEIQENIFIVFFKSENADNTVEEDDNLEIYDKLSLNEEAFEKILQKNIHQSSDESNSKVIVVSGANGVGKSTFSAFLAKSVESENLKTLLVDFDLDENQVRTILKIKKQPNYNNEIEDLIINMNKNLDVLCHLDIAFQNKEKIDYFVIQKMLKNLKDTYDLIIIDTSSNLENEFTKKIFYHSDEIIFLMEPNIIGVKKSKNILEIFEEMWKIDLVKIKLILNKTNIYQISDAIIEELFPEIQLVGKIKYNDVYNLVINKTVDKKEIKKEYEKIYKKIKV